MFITTASSTCTNRAGKPRRAYPDRSSAEAGARHALAVHGHRMVPYRCERCRQWHLCPASRHTPSHDCAWCSKKAYETEEAAERRAAILGVEQGVALRVYECPHGDGWHLTSKR